MISVRLTPAQQSALECAGLDLEDDDHPTLRAAFAAYRGRLWFPVRDRDALADELTAAANSEDAAVEQGMGSGDDLERAIRAQARGARDALTNLAAKVRSAS